MLSHLNPDMVKNCLLIAERSSNLSPPVEDVMQVPPSANPMLHFRMHVRNHGLDVVVGAIAKETELVHCMPLANCTWAMLLVGSSAIGFVLSRALREPELLSCLSFWDAGRVVVRDLAGLPQRDVSVVGAYAMLVTVGAALFLFARRRMRVVEALQ